MAKFGEGMLGKMVAQGPEEFVATMSAQPMPEIETPKAPQPQEMSVDQMADAAAERVTNVSKEQVMEI